MTPAQIKGELDAHFRHAAPWTLRQVNRNLTPRGADLVYMARGTQTRLAIKVNCRLEKNTREYEALRRMHQLGVDCAQPLWLAPGRSFYAMTWLPGADLRRRMHDSDRLELIAAAGRWLADYHRRTQRKIWRRDKALLAPVLPAGFAGSSLAPQIVARRDRLRLNRGPMASLHTDFQLQNLSDSGGRISAFDPVSHRIGHVYFDVARFLIGAELHRHIFAQRGQPWPDDPLIDRKTFLQAYGGVPILLRGQLDVIEDLQLARLWGNFSSRRHKDAGAIQRLRILEEMLALRALTV